MADKDITTNTYMDKENGDWYFLKTRLFFPERIFFCNKHYCSLTVSTFVNKKKKDAETMIFKLTGRSILDSGKRHSLADALPTHIETVERLKSMYKKN